MFLCAVFLFQVKKILPYIPLVFFNLWIVDVSQKVYRFFIDHFVIDF